MSRSKLRGIAKIAGLLVGFVLAFILGVYGYSKFQDQDRLKRLRACIDVQLPDFKKTFQEVGLSLGDAEMLIDADGKDEYARYPVLGDGEGAPIRFYQVHSADQLCKAGLIDAGQL